MCSSSSTAPPPPPSIVTTDFSLLFHRWLSHQRLRRVPAKVLHMLAPFRAHSILPALWLWLLAPPLTFPHANCPCLLTLPLSSPLTLSSLPPPVPSALHTRWTIYAAWVRRTLQLAVTYGLFDTPARLAPHHARWAYPRRFGAPFAGIHAAARAARRNSRRIFLGARARRVSDVALSLDESGRRQVWRVTLCRARS